MGTIIIRAHINFLNLSALVLIQVGSISASLAKSPSPDEVIRVLTQQKNQVLQRLNTLDHQISDAKGTSEIDAALPDYREQKWRVEFLDRLIFQTESKFKGNDLNSFLINTLSNMAVLEAKNSSDERNSFWRTLSYLSELLKQNQERSQDPLTLIFSYLEKSQMTKPISAGEFLKQADYSNGLRAETAVDFTTNTPSTTPKPSPTPPTPPVSTAQDKTTDKPPAAIAIESSKN